MQRALAIKTLTKLIGKSFSYRVNDKAPSKEEREEAKKASPGLIAIRAAADKAVNERRNAVLAADNEYQRLVAEYKSARETAAKELAKMHQYKFTVGKVVGGLFFSVMAEGDSWEEVIDKVKANR